MEFSGKKVTVVGTGISGIGAVGLLNAVGAEVVLYDGNEKLKIEDIEKKLGTYKAEIVLGELTKELTVRIYWLSVRVCRLTARL